MALGSNANGVQLAERLRIRPINVERGSERFSYHSDNEYPPQNAAWRNNLVALSQRRNLMFAGISHQIYVWKPAGVSQSLGTKPEAIITPVMKNPQGAGFIAPYFPHAINSMLLSDLGLEEILLLATDSGNVCGYRVEAIYSALERAIEEGASRPLNDSQIYPFFAEYVGCSAWGLAVHKFARQIAVSSNTGLITVFAFALVGSGETDEQNSDYIMESSSATGTDEPWYNIDNNEDLLAMRTQLKDAYRSRNIRMTYTGHFTNIPSVSFLNCDLDPNGAWMLSTGINNKLFVWKVWESLSPVNVFDFNGSAPHFVHGMLDNEYEIHYTRLEYLHSLIEKSSDCGWSVLALDPRIFRRVKRVNDACGGQPQFRERNGQWFIDISLLTAHVPDASHMYNYFPPAAKTEPECPFLPDIFSPDCQMVSPGCVPLETRSAAFTHCSDEGKSTANNVSSLEDTAVIRSRDAIEPHPPDPVSEHRSLAAGEYTEGSNESQRASRGTEAIVTSRTGLLSRDVAQGSEATSVLTDAVMAATGSYQLVLAEDSNYGEREGSMYNSSDDGDHSYFTESEEIDNANGETAEGEGDDQCQQRDDCFFVQSLTWKSTDGGAFNDIAYKGFPILHFSQTDIRLIPQPLARHHIVVCREPLRQPFSHPVPSLRSRDRFNMVQPIPDLGIVVAASQKGRVAIISLTESEETGMAFRIDWILPFESQEKYGERPLVYLVGMGASPVQGFEMPPDIPYIPGGAQDLACPTINCRLLDMSKRQEAAQITTTAHLYSDLVQPEGKIVTHAERHALANRIYRPDEPWRGWHKSRHYRLFLMYADHTVMTYELWHGDKAEGSPGWESDGGAHEDPYLMF